MPTNGGRGVRLGGEEGAAGAAAAAGAVLVRAQAAIQGPEPGTARHARGGNANWCVALLRILISSPYHARYTVSPHPPRPACSPLCGMHPSIYSPPPLTHPCLLVGYAVDQSRAVQPCPTNQRRGSGGRAPCRSLRASCCRAPPGQWGTARARHSNPPLRAGEHPIRTTRRPPRMSCARLAVPISQGRAAGGRAGGRGLVALPARGVSKRGSAYRQTTRLAAPRM
jgi:hypothetical protein